MTKQQYFTKAIPDQVFWFNNFGEKILAYETPLSLSSDQILKITGGVSKFNLLVNYLKAIDTFKQAVTNFRNIFTKGTTEVMTSIPTLVAPSDPDGWVAGYFAFIFNIVANIKTNANYTDAIGKDLGIIGAAPTFDPSTFQPSVSAAYNAASHSNLIKFEISESEGSNIYSRKAGDTVWTFVAYDTHSPYHDTRPLAVPGVPEKREYQAVAVLHSVQIGVPSAIVSAIFGG